MSSPEHATKAAPHATAAHATHSSDVMSARHSARQLATLQYACSPAQAAQAEERLDSRHVVAQSAETSISVPHDVLQLPKVVIQAVESA